MKIITQHRITVVVIIDTDNELVTQEIFEYCGSSKTL